MWSVSLLQIQNLKCLSHLQLIMTRNGRVPGTSARTMPGDCWRSGHGWCRVCRVPASLYPWCHVPHCLLTAGTGGHHRLCSTLSPFVLKALRSPIIFEEGIFTGGWLLPTCCLWDQGLVFRACGQQLLSCLQQGGMGTRPGSI